MTDEDRRIIEILKLDIELMGRILRRFRPGQPPFGAVEGDRRLIQAAINTPSVGDCRSRRSWPRRAPGPRPGR